MSYESNTTISLQPHVANLVEKHRFVSILAGGIVDETNGLVDAVGVSQETSLAGNANAIPVMLLNGGKIEVEAGATVTSGVRVMSDSTGRVIDAVGATARVLGYSINGGAVGEAITIVSQKAAGEFTA